jgi:hypothetical protein
MSKSVSLGAGEGLRAILNHILAPKANVDE